MSIIRRLSINTITSKRLSLIDIYNKIPVGGNISGLRYTTHSSKLQKGASRLFEFYNVINVQFVGCNKSIKIGPSTIIVIADTEDEISNMIGTLQSFL